MRPIAFLEIKDELVKAIIKELPETLRAHEEHWKKLAEQRLQLLNEKANELMFMAAGRESDRMDADRKASEKICEARTDGYETGFASGKAEGHRSCSDQINQLTNQRDALRITRQNQDIEIERVNKRADGYYDEIRNLQASVENLREDLAKVTKERDDIRASQHDTNIIANNRALRIFALESDLSDAQELAATVQKNLHNANLELAMKRTVITTLQDRLATFSIHTPNDKQDCVRLAVASIGGLQDPIQVGDCWVCRKTGETRCVIAADIEDGVKYHHCHKARPEGYTTKCSFRNFRSHIAESYVGRNVFFPAMYPDEPTAGFRVGDRWTKENGAIRIIKSVDNTHISYDFRLNEHDNEPDIIKLRRSEVCWKNTTLRRSS